MQIAISEIAIANGTDVCRFRDSVNPVLVRSNLVSAGLIEPNGWSDHSARKLVEIYEAVMAEYFDRDGRAGKSLEEVRRSLMTVGYRSTERFPDFAVAYLDYQLREWLADDARAAVAPWVSLSVQIDHRRKRAALLEELDERFPHAVCRVN